MTEPQPRVRLPETVTRGEPFVGRALLSHRMETGLRHDERGNIVPRKIINRFVCRYNGVEVFAVDLFEAVSANPYYPHELAPIVKQRAERYYNVTRFTKFEQGGHFAVHERAEEMAGELREFFRTVR